MIRQTWFVLRANFIIAEPLSLKSLGARASAVMENEAFRRNKTQLSRLGRQVLRWSLGRARVLLISGIFTKEFQPNNPQWAEQALNGFNSRRTNCV